MVNVAECQSVLHQSRISVCEPCRCLRALNQSSPRAQARTITEPRRTTCSHSSAFHEPVRCHCRYAPIVDLWSPQNTAVYLNGRFGEAAMQRPIFRPRSALGRERRRARGHQALGPAAQRRSGTSLKLSSCSCTAKVLQSSFLLPIVIEIFGRKPLLKCCSAHRAFVAEDRKPGNIALPVVVNYCISPCSLVFEAKVDRCAE